MKFDSPPTDEELLQMEILSVLMDEYIDDKLFKKAREVDL